MSRNDVILGAVALVLVVFSLVVSLFIPRRDPGFPGRNLKVFVVVAILLVVAMLAAVEVLGESHESEGGEAVAEETGQTGETEGGGGDEGGDEGAAEGDPAAGEQVYASAGCGSCHVLEEAGSSGTVGPSLDDSTVSFDEAVRQISEGGGGMPPFQGQLSEEEIRDVAAFVVASQG